MSLPKTTPPLQPAAASAPVAAPAIVPAAAPTSTPAANATPVAEPEPSASSVPASEPVSESESGKSAPGNKLVTIEYNSFLPGTVQLKPEAGSELDAVVKYARKHPDVKLEITGYSDNKARPSLSLGLADSVRNYLVTKGVAGHRISISGAGSAYPIADNQTRKGRAKNRRVEIFSVAKKESKEPIEAPVAATPTSIPTAEPAPVPEESAAPKPKPNAAMRVMVNAIHVSGNSKIATAELESLLGDLVGSDHTLAELTEGAARITAYYHQRGYIVARAYIPPQEIKDGVVTINVEEGHIGEQRIDNQSRLSDQRASGYFGGINSGEVLQAAPVERALLLLNETPGVGSARASLQPGASVGATDLVIELAPSAAYAGNIQADNYGNYFTGEYRLGAELGFNSPLKIGDQITFRALTSDQNLIYAYAAYQIPVGSRGLRMGAAYSDTSYRLGKEFASLDAHGTATIASLFAVYPFIRSQKSNLSGTITLEYKQLNDVNLVLYSDKTVQVGTLGVTGNHQDTLGGAGVTLYNVSVATGHLSMDPVSLFIDELTINTNGAFTRIDYNLNRLQRLSSSYSLSLALSGQFASKNLNSSEQFSLGGAYGVRAYPQGEGAGDQGHIATIELRHSFSPMLQGVMFYDAGTIMINRDPIPYLPVSNTRFLSGAGIGLNAFFAGMQFKADLAARGSGGQPTSEPTTMDRKVRLWAELQKQF
ncbi:MAG TPA: ShlB/FhaC/HecB family hemolysin secretion/activation protein [Gallionella sp.]|nr:ShlB/FhaC/HecB family hemolysin secretion/activation protein [Gallionella sp.]